MTLVVRDATAADADACAALYAPYVTGTTTSFETDPPGPAEVRRRIADAQRGHAWLVAEDDDRLVGYAYAGPYRSRAAYRWTAEVSVYVARGEGGRGTGRALYAALLERLTERGYRTAVAAMTLPNPASAALHAAAGFVPAGVLASVGWKHGRWHDVALLHRRLGDDPTGDPGDEGPPAEPS